MKKYTPPFLVLIALVSFAVGCKQTKTVKSDNDAEVFSVEKAKKALDFSMEQYKGFFSVLSDSTFPRSVHKDGSIVEVRAKDWTSGFYPGTLWYLYEYSKDEDLLTETKKRTELLNDLRYHTGTHDLGFMVHCSYGNGYRITADSAYKEVIIDASKSLATRFNEKAGVIKSWDFIRRGWSYPVIIDNMMNLEMLLWASKETQSEKLKEISISHADTTLKYHYRKDMSTFHVVDYDTINSGTKMKVTHQGFSDDSAWARGQTWGLYGYTMMYRETKKPEYLERAKAVAKFIMEHPRLPDDKVPYWDFDAPDIPDAPRDASSAAIITSALLELSGFVEEDLKKSYLDFATAILATLSSPAYTAELGANGNFILMHSTGHLPADSEIDVPINYADYYYVEALMRYLSLHQ